MTHADDARMETGNQVQIVHSCCVGNGQLNQSQLQKTVGALNCMHDQQLILAENVVRRLTPTECERLQGLEDGYTDGGSDTARYKALGNGMAQPCADYVIRRIAEATRAERKESNDR
nr:MAG TPA: Cytosine specific methyltransferase [Caudoviricetes sp.]